MKTHTLSVGAIAAAALLAAQASAQSSLFGQFGDQDAVYNIDPPGQDGGLNTAETAQAQNGDYPDFVLDQQIMYDTIINVRPDEFTDADLPQYFKVGSFGIPDEEVARTYSPDPEVTITRGSKHGVPHVEGSTRRGAMFGQGYTGAEDRLFLMDILRHVGRARVSEFVGGAEGNQRMDRGQLAVAAYTDEDLTAQVNFFRDSEDPGYRRVYDDGIAYAEGVNAFINEALADPSLLPGEYPALQKMPEPWSLEDSIAVGSLVGGIFGKGGGGELRNHCAVKRLTEASGDATLANEIFEDFHFSDYPGPTTSTRKVDMNGRPATRDSALHPQIDCDSLRSVEEVNGEGAAEARTTEAQRAQWMNPHLAQAALLDEEEERSMTIDLPWKKNVSLKLPSGMSNAFVIGKEHTNNGRPVAVFGPQTGYFFPQLLVEKDVHGPGISARGVSFAGTDLWVQLGRGEKYAWSATSAGADNVDTFVLRLCEPGGGTATIQSMGYMVNGACKDIETFQHEQLAVPTAGGVPDTPEDIQLSFRVERTPEYGIIQARGVTEDGTPIATSILRSTYQNEIKSGKGFANICDPDFMTDGVNSFREAFGEPDQQQFTFNWFYVDKDDIAYQHSGLIPKRKPELDPWFPVWGDGTSDWQGFYSFEEQPFDVNPAQGYLSSWNNRQADGLTASDSQKSYGPVYRVFNLNQQIELAINLGKKYRRSAWTALMYIAGTKDLRGSRVFPSVFEVMGPTPPAGSDPRSLTMVEQLKTWVERGSHRLDFDADGEYDDAQSPAITDAVWNTILDAMFKDTSFDALGKVGVGRHDSPGAHLGSAFNGASYGHVYQDLNQLLGNPELPARWSRSYCGDGDLEACRMSLWGAFDTAAVNLEAEFGSADVADWQRAKADDEIRSTAFVSGIPPMDWQNRPTFQQVVQFKPTDPELPEAEDMDACMVEYFGGSLDLEKFRQCQQGAPAPAPAPTPTPTPAPTPAGEGEGEGEGETPADEGEDSTTTGGDEDTTTPPVADDDDDDDASMDDADRTDSDDKNPMSPGNSSGGSSVSDGDDNDNDNDNRFQPPTRSDDTNNDNDNGGNTNQDRNTSAASSLAVSGLVSVAVVALALMNM